MYQIVYLSTAFKDMSQIELDELMAISHLNNVRDQITGILVYVDGSIIQLIEGPEYNVQRLYRKIQMDMRHHGIIRLYEGAIENRLFPHWTMAYKRLTTSEFIADIGIQLNLVEKDLLPLFENQEAKGMKLLRSFYVANKGSI
ncbi:MAG: BLUF domain-containing protein [Bacteroidota bacterium]